MRAELIYLISFKKKWCCKIVPKECDKITQFSLSSIKHPVKKLSSFLKISIWRLSRSELLRNWIFWRHNIEARRRLWDSLGLFADLVEKFSSFYVCHFSLLLLSIKFYIFVGLNRLKLYLLHIFLFTFGNDVKLPFPQGLVLLH